MEIKLDKESLVVEQNNCLTKIVNCLFRATNVVKNSDKDK